MNLPMSYTSNVMSSPKLMYNNVYPSTKISTLFNRNIIIRSMKMPNGETSDRTNQGLTSGFNEKIRGTNIEPCNSSTLPINGLYNDKNLAPTLNKIERSMNIVTPELTTESSTLGRYLAQRLVQIGINDVFGVPGDSNLSLLDQLILEPRLNLVGCCNELNAGYAADGYARSRGVGACVFTFTVGGLSAINAIAGAYSENIPVICIVGGPNSNYYSKNVALHHTIGLKDFSQELRCFQQVTCYQAMINNLEDAQEQIDTAIKVALHESKPVYVHISSNLASIPYPSFSTGSIPLFFPPRISNPVSLEAAVKAAARLLNKAANPVLVGGARLRSSRAKESFLELVNTCGYGMAVMPAAKGLVPEDHPQFMETYWGPAGAPCCANIVESADAYLYVGPVFDDISSLGFTTIFDKEKMIVVYPERVVIGNDSSFGDVFMNDFLEGLSKRIRRNNTSYENYRLLMRVQKILPLPTRKNEELKVGVMFKHIEELLSNDSVIIADTGDSWFRTQKLKLPEGCRYEVQMHYASIGWSVGASLGYAQAAPHRRVITCIGDGSFQMTVQEVSTMLRCGHRSIIFLINNGGYSTEIPISDGPYNVIKNWDYSKVVSAIDNHEEKCWVAKVHCEAELISAIKMATGEKADKLCFIEVIVGKHDTSTDLVKLGTRLAQANSSLPTASL